MKIILFHQYYLGKDDSGGSRWNQFTKYFTQEDKDIHIEIMSGNIHYATGKQMSSKTWNSKEVISDKITLHRTWTYSGYNRSFFGRLLGYFSYSSSAFLKALFIRDVDIIIVTSPPIFVGLSGLVLSKVKKIPFIFEVRDLWPESAISTGVLNNKVIIKILYSLEKMLYTHAEKIVLLTPAFKKDIIKRYPMVETKLKTVTNGADFDMPFDKKKRKIIREKYGWEDKKVFAYFGAHGVANDLEQIIAVANVYKNDDRILFVLIGDGMQKGELKKLVNLYNLSNIQFIDSVSKMIVNDYIYASDICIAILKKTDTFKTVYPNKVFDYMRCEKPILVTIDGITRTLIEESKSGLYAPPEDVNALKKVIDSFLLRSEEELKQMGIKGSLYVQLHFSREKLAVKYLKIIKKEFDASIKKN